MTNHTVGVIPKNIDAMIALLSNYRMRLISLNSTLLAILQSILLLFSPARLSFVELSNGEPIAANNFIGASTPVVYL